MSVLIGIDVGTTGTKAGAYAADGRALGTAHVETTLRRRGDAFDQDPAELLDSAYTAVRQCVARSGVDIEKVEGLAVSGQMAGLMGIDSKWRPVTAYDSWLDSRCAPQLRRLAAKHGSLITERTGCPPMLNHAPKMQWWRSERPEDYARIEKFVMPAVYVAGEMAGLSAAEAFIDPSYLHFTGVADSRAGAWSPELLEALEVEVEKLPRIVPSDSLIGSLTGPAAERCGLPAGVPIAAGLGDTAAGVLGAGIVEKGQVLDTAGTAAVLVGCVDAFRSDPGERLIVMRGALAEIWLPLNYVAGAGLCVPWLLKLTGGVNAGGKAAITELLAEAGEVEPGSEGLLFAPHFEGRIAPYDPGMRGGWLGLGLGHGRGHLARAILEAVAFEYATYLQVMQELYPETSFERIYGIGGGARSTVWNAIKADVTGLPYEQVAAEETATRGAALIAGAATRVVDHLAAVAASVERSARIDPDAGRHAFYAEQLPRYVELIDWNSTRTTTTPPPSERQLVA